MDVLAIIAIVFFLVVLIITFPLAMWLGGKHAEAEIEKRSDPKYVGKILGKLPEELEELTIEEMEKILSEAIGREQDREMENLFKPIGKAVGLIQQQN